MLGTYIWSSLQQVDTSANLISGYNPPPIHFHFIFLLNDYHSYYQVNIKIIGHPGVSGIISDDRFWFHQRIFLLFSLECNVKVPLACTEPHIFSILTLLVQAAIDILFSQTMAPNYKIIKCGMVNTFSQVSN